jgi:hypothetical protein
MKINKQEAENILNMMLSTDQDNGYMAFKAIEAHSFTKNNFGYLIYFYKFSKYTVDEWEKNAPKAHKILSTYFNLKEPLTYAKGLATMISEKNDKEIIELFLSRHVKELSNMLESMGYPIDKLDFNLTLKS